MVQLGGRNFLCGVGDRKDFIVKLSTVVFSDSLLGVSFVLVLNHGDSVGLSELVISDFADLHRSELDEKLEDLTVSNLGWKI